MRGATVFGRKKQRSHTSRLMDELSESYGHLRMAAGHAAGGAAERLTPRYDRARTAARRRWSTTKDTFTPLYVQMREGAANARKEHKVKRNKWPVVVGILAAGAAAGAAGAVIARRRRAVAQWDEYDPMPSLAEPVYGEPKAGGATQKVTASAASVADTVSTQASKLADSLHGKARATAEKSQGTFAPFAEETDDATRNSKNSRP
jgi:hypothetical protein